MSRTPDESAPSAHPLEVTLAAFVDGALSEKEAHEVARHLDACGDCRRLVTGTIHVLDDAAADERPRAAVQGNVSRPVILETGSKVDTWRLGRRSALALAASIVLVMIARTVVVPSANEAQRSSSPRVVPGEGLPVLEAYEPANGDTVAAAGLRFTWSATASERYRLVLATDDGTPVWTADTQDTTIALADSVVLRPGALYFWHADAVGSGLAAKTRLQRFIVAR